MAILRLPDVLAETGHRSQASIYGKIKSGLFTQPVKIGERSSGWPSDEVKAICAARVAGATDTQLRELVECLHVQRAERFKALLGNVTAPEITSKRTAHSGTVAQICAAA